jgi:hypothetical protein
MRPDYSTIDWGRLQREVKPYVKPPTYWMDGLHGSACIFEPPGHPTYFMEGVFTRFGNSPARGPQYVLTRPATEALYPVDHETIGRYYLPLPLEHERVQAWIAALWEFFRCCYHVPGAAANSSPVIYPVPAYALRSEAEADDPRFSERYKAALLAEIRQYNQDEVAEAAAIATLDNHCAVRAVREYYPAYTPAGLPPRSTGNWWEVYAARPTPAECPGETFGWGDRSRARHPVNGTWCQVCGWRGEGLEK